MKHKLFGGIIAGITIVALEFLYIGHKELTYTIDSLDKRLKKLEK